MADQVDLFWHGPYRLDTNLKKDAAEVRIDWALGVRVRKLKGIYLIWGQKPFQPWTRRPLYIGATIRTFEDRLIEHAGGKAKNINLPDSKAFETANDANKIVRAENEGYQITSIWLGEMRNDAKERVQDLALVERTLVYFFDPLYNAVFKSFPANECLIINRYDREWAMKKDQQATPVENIKPFEWHIGKLPSIIDMRPADMDNKNNDPKNILGDAYFFKGGSRIMKRHLKIERGAIWRKKFRKEPKGLAGYPKPPISAVNS